MNEQNAITLPLSLIELNTQHSHQGSVLVVGRHQEHTLQIKVKLQLRQS